MHMIAVPLVAYARPRFFDARHSPRVAHTTAGQKPRMPVENTQCLVRCVGEGQHQMSEVPGTGFQTTVRRV